MYKKILSYVVIFTVFIATVWAGDLENANTAYDNKDYVTALSEYKKAALKNNAFAQFRIGFMHMFGRGVLKDPTEAVRWYKMAAEQGNVPAQMNLGSMYSYGLGVERDEILAYMWSNLAAGSGDQGAINNLEKIARMMTSQQIAEAKK